MSLHLHQVAASDASLSVAVIAPLVAPLSADCAYGNHQFVVDLGRALRRLGHDVTIYAAAGSTVEGVPVEQVFVEAPLDRRFLLLRAHGVEESTAMRKAFDRVAARVVDAGHDVVSQHACDAEAFDAFAGLPVLHTLHVPPTIPSVVDAARTTSSPLVTVSRACAADWTHALGRKVMAIPNGVPTFLVTGSGVEDVALIAGRFSPEKGTATAVRTAKRAKLRPVLVGEIYDQDYFDRSVAPLLGSAQPCRRAPREVLVNVMAGAAVLLLPVEWDEPFGLVAAEALRAGCPVVGYRRGALAEVVTDGIDGFLVTPGDEDALVAAILRSRALDRHAIRERASHRYAMSICGQRYASHLRRVATAVVR